MTLDLDIPFPLIAYRVQRTSSLAQASSAIILLTFSRTNEDSLSHNVADPVAAGNVCWPLETNESTVALLLPSTV